MFIVTLTNNGQQYWLRGTTWAFRAERAQSFETQDQAQKALAAARQFMKPSLFKLASIQEVSAAA